MLVIGGSGSGKTRYHIKPNLLQMNASYVCSDPKGTVIEEVGRALVRGGYKIKVLNTIDFSCSMHYNPFVYLHSETDILTLVTVIMTNTQGEAKGGDGFWEKAEALLLKEPQTAAYTAEIYKRFRKWNGIPTALTQNVKDLLESPEIENILENSDFILMLNQAASDRNILAQRLGISPQELGHITNSDAGEGLLFFGDKIIPFVDKFPTDTKLYQVMTTKPADLAA